MVADDVNPGTKQSGASVSCLYLLEKMESKTIRSNIFWDLDVQVLFQNHFSSVTRVRVNFRFERLGNELRSSTFDNRELTA